MCLLQIHVNHTHTLYKYLASDLLCLYMDYIQHVYMYMYDKTARLPALDDLRLLALDGLRRITHGVHTKRRVCVCERERERCVYVCVVCTQYKYMYLQCGVSVSQLLQVESEMLSVQSDQLLSRVHH